MEVKRIQPSFGMVLKNPKTPCIDSYLNSLPPHIAFQIEDIAKAEMTNKIPVYLTMIMRYCRPRFAVEIGGKQFVENIFQGPLTVLKRGVKYARKINAEQEAINEAWGNSKITTRI